MSAYQQVRLLQKYRENDVSNASPIRLIIMAYDAAITACRKQDLDVSTRALGILKDSLDLSQGQVAMNLMSLYLFCADGCRAGKWNLVAEILSELRTTWVKLEKQVRSKSRTPVPLLSAKPAYDSVSMQPAAF